jgi:hypothetical protein
VTSASVNHRWSRDLIALAPPLPSTREPVPARIASRHPRLQRPCRSTHSSRYREIPFELRELQVAREANHPVHLQCGGPPRRQSDGPNPATSSSEGRNAQAMTVLLELRFGRERAKGRVRARSVVDRVADWRVDWKWVCASESNHFAHAILNVGEQGTTAYAKRHNATTRV